MTKNEEIVSGLRALIAFIEANDDFDFGAGEDSDVVVMHFRTWYAKDEDAKQVVGDLARRLGKVTKRYSGDFAWLERRFGARVNFEITTERDKICERVVTGTKVVPAHGEIIIPAAPETVEEIVEWKCHPILEAAQ